MCRLSVANADTRQGGVRGVHGKVLSLCPDTESGWIKIFAVGNELNRKILGMSQLRFGRMNYSYGARK